MNGRRARKPFLADGFPAIDRDSANRLRGRIAVIALVTVAAISGVAALMSRGHDRSSRPGTPPAVGTIIKAANSDGTYTVSYPVAVPNGYNAPTGLAVDPSGTGVWFFADSTTARTVFHWTASSGKLTDYSLSLSNPDLAAGAITPIVVDAQGRAWVGINHTLAMVDPATNSVQTYPLPAVTLAGPPLVLLPPTPPGVSPEQFAVVDSLAVGANGSIVIGRQFANELQVFSPGDGTFSSITLPVNAVLAGTGQNLGATPNGEVVAILYVGSSSAEVALESGGAWYTVSSTCEPLSLTVGAALTLAGPDCVADSHISSSGVTGTLSPLPSAWTALVSHITTAISISAGIDAVGTGGGIDVVDAASGAGTPVDLGQIVLSGESSPGGGSNSTKTVPITPGLVASDGSGTVWFTIAEGGLQLGLLAPG